MTNAFEMQDRELEKQQRKNAKTCAKHILFSGQNGLTMIAVVLLPPIFLLAAIQVCSMLGLAYNKETPQMWASLLMVILLLAAVALILPMFGGTVYVATGLVRGESRQINDLFYAYTSWRAHIRTWIAFLLPMLALSAVTGLAGLVFRMCNGLCDMAWALDLGEAYGGMFAGVGVIAFVAVLLLGLFFCGYIMPFFWLVFLYPRSPLGLLMKHSFTLMHKKLGRWLGLQISFVGWLLLSVATAGILYVLFAGPYYLITVSCYLDMQDEKQLNVA